MPRKPEPSFKLKQIIWDLAATTGAKNLSALRKDLDYNLEQLRKNPDEDFLEDVPEIRTIRRIIEEDINQLEPEVVIAKLPPHVWRLRRDYEDIRDFAKRYSPRDGTSEQEPYEETLHKQKMRKLAKALAREISIPTPWDKDLWRDLPVEFKAGEYSLSIGKVKIRHDRKIKLKYHDIGAGVAAPHLVRGLYSHLGTSGLPKFTELVSDNGKLNSLVREIERYSQALLAFLKLILDDVTEYRVKTNFHDEAETGVTRWFIITVWHCVLWSALGNSEIDDSLYGPPESVPGTSLWQVRWGGSVIGIARGKKTLRMYESMHKKLRDTHTENPLVRKIAARYKRLNQSAQDIRQRLEEFSDMQRLPGHCQLC